ncbi:MAG: iron ABC transporter substrate-binding protein [Desulfobulbaceae bacterium]|nr:MAG: iron ABC transporter substrate-binding protein [Desulfobulbaceae bacterium]
MRLILLIIAALLPLPQSTLAREITDTLGRKVEIPDTVERVICSGSGCLRLLTYLQAQDMAVAVDDIEGRRRQFDARPYAMANPRFKTLPVFGEFRGKDNPELIMTLDPAPQVILKLVGTGKGTVGPDPAALQEKTGIPVVALKYGNLGKMKEDLYNSLRIMAEVVGREQRADAVLTFFDEQITDLKKRTADIPEEQRPSVYLGGVAYAGPHGFQSTEPTYPPFHFVNARNLADNANPKAGEITSTDIAKEKIVEWNPDYLFLDLSTLQLGDAAGGLFELKTDPAYRTLNAVKTGKVYGVLPYNWYNQNFESIFSDAYFIGKLLYPERFSDIDPAAKADEIYTFMVGKPVFAEMNALFGNLAFRDVPLN